MEDERKRETDGKEAGKEDQKLMADKREKRACKAKRRKQEEGKEGQEER